MYTVLILFVATNFLLLPTPTSSHAGSATPAVQNQADVTPGYGKTITIAPSAASGSGLALSIQNSIPVICPNDATTCSANVGDSLVSLVAKANSTGVRAWPAVSVIFVIETGPYDGAFDPTARDPGNDSCALLNPGTSVLCDESNGVPLFATHAGTIAKDIEAEHPGTRFTFGLVDYSAAYDRWDDGDGYEYHVDIGRPVPASAFGAAVNSSFVNGTLGGNLYLPGSGLSDNILESSSITALYGVLAGAGITWSNDTHHVVVWMGSTAPRDPNYPEDYCPSPSSHVSRNTTSTCTLSADSKYMAPTCEPSYLFGATGILSPNCEGWVQSHSGVAGDSIAEFAHSNQECRASLGGNCTIDTIVLFDGLTAGIWPGNWSIGVDNSVNVSKAGCDIASATDGTTVQPAEVGDCPSTVSLYGNQFGSYTNPNTNNSNLMDAFANIGLGTPPGVVAAFGSSRSTFTFAPTGSIALDPDFAPHATCSSPNGSVASCQGTPAVVHVGMSTVLEWNWSTDPNLNVLYRGDVWTAYLRVMATGPPLDTPVPIDACTTVACFDYGSQEVGGFFTSANYFEPVVNATQDASFPLALITVVGQPPNSGGTSPPSPPPSGGIPPPVPVPTPVGPPVVQPAPVLLTVVSAGGISIQAGVAGLLAAGFARVVIQPRAIPMKIGVKSGALTSKFDAKAQASSDKLGRFE